MAKTIEFTPEVERRLAEVARQGIDTDRFINEAVEEKLRHLARAGDDVAMPGPNEGMLEALRRVREIQKDMPTTPGDSVAILREGRRRPLVGSSHELMQGQQGVDTNHFYFTASQEEWERAFDELSEGNEKLPVLPPEAFERESIYED